MEQSSSWERNTFSAGQDIPPHCVEPEGHYRIHNSPSPFRILSQIDPVTNRMCRNIIKFLWWGVLAPRPTSKLEGHPLSAAALHFWRSFPHPQPEDSPCRGDRDQKLKIVLPRE
jgi:hypothetical protein